MISFDLFCALFDKDRCDDYDEEILEIKYISVMVWIIEFLSNVYTV